MSRVVGSKIMPGTHLFWTQKSRRALLVHFARRHAWSRGGHFWRVCLTLAVHSYRFLIDTRLSTNPPITPAKTRKHLNLLPLLHPEHVSQRSNLSVEACRKLLLVDTLGKVTGWFWAPKSAHYWLVLTAR